MYLANWEETVFLFFNVVTMFLCRSNVRLQPRRLMITPASAASRVRRLCHATGPEVADNLFIHLSIETLEVEKHEHRLDNLHHVI